MSKTNVLLQQQDFFLFTNKNQKARRLQFSNREKQAEKNTITTFCRVGCCILALFYQSFYQISIVRLVLSLSHYFFCLQKIVGKKLKNYHCKGDTANG